MRAVHLANGPRGYGIANEYDALICTGMTRAQALHTVRGGVDKEPPLGVSAKRAQARARNLRVGVRPQGRVSTKRLGPGW